MSNYDKLNFGRTLSESDGDFNNHGDCFNYGSISGCDSGCPQLRDGKCESFAENMHLINGDEELEDIYKDRMTK